MTTFMPGVELAHLYYIEAVRPILEAHFAHLEHSAALLGPGSEVLGFDTEMSTDHSWGPRLILFLAEVDHLRLAVDLGELLGNELPFTFRGYSTSFEKVADESGTLLLKEAYSRPIKHRVQIHTINRFVLEYCGIDLQRGLTVRDWLTVPEQKLRTLVAGAVFHDGLNELESMRRKVAYYPHDIWLYLLSAQWQRIGQEAPFVGRAGVVGDELGSTIIAARLVRDLMRLCFLLERQYVPYAKWYGTAFSHLACAPRLLPILTETLQSSQWQARERHLAEAYETVATMHNELGITEPVLAATAQFYDRPFQVIDGERIARLTWEAIRDVEVRSLPFGVGKVEQYVDSTDILSHQERYRRLGDLYTGS